MAKTFNLSSAANASGYRVNDWGWYIHSATHGRRFHGCRTLPTPGGTGEFRPNGYVRSLCPDFNDSQLPDYLRPVGYWSRELERLSQDWPVDDSDLVGRGLTDAMMHYFEPDPAIAEAQMRMLMGNVVIPNITTKYPPMGPGAVERFLSKLDRRIPKEKE